MATFKATYRGETIGWYETLAQAEAAIRIAEDPYGPDAFCVVVLGLEAYMEKIKDNIPEYVLVG